MSTLAGASGGVRRAGGPLGTLWRFGRPHTVIGTSLSVASIWAISLAVLPGTPSVGRAVAQLALALLAGLAVNGFITGINQLEDVEIDRVNKPFLPLASGELTMGQGRVIVAACAVIPLVLGLLTGWVQLLAVAVALSIGLAYSVPPLRLKRFPTLASLSISLVRGIVVNLGVALHFSHQFGQGWTVPGPVWALTLFVVPYSFAIAVLKDVPDMEGDRLHHIATFSVRNGAAWVTGLGMGVLTLSYLGMATVGALLLDDASAVVLVVGHLVALAALWAARRRTAVEDRESFTAFYMDVWRLFFAEYVIVAIACLAA